MPADETPAEAADRLARSLGANPRVIAGELRALASRLEEESRRMASRLEEEARRLRLWADGLSPHEARVGRAVHVSKEVTGVTNFAFAFEADGVTLIDPVSLDWGDDLGLEDGTFTVVADCVVESLQVAGDTVIDERGTVVARRRPDGENDAG